MADDIWNDVLEEIDTVCLHQARELADKGAEHLVLNLSQLGIKARVFRDKEDRYYLYVDDTCLAVSDMGHQVDSLDELYGRSIEMFSTDPIQA